MGNTNGCWMQKSGVNECQTSDCDGKFGWFSKTKHHCYVCGIVVCSKCTSNKWRYRNRNRRCRNAGNHQNREKKCLQRRITLGSCNEAQWLREMMIAIPHLVGPR